MISELTNRRQVIDIAIHGHLDEASLKALDGSQARVAVVAEGAPVPEGQLDAYVTATRPRTFGINYRYTWN